MDKGKENRPAEFRGRAFVGHKPQTTLEERLRVSFPALGTSISSAVLIVAVLFGLIHLAIGLATAAAALVLGLLAGELRRRSSSLLPPIVLRAIFNVFSAVW